MNVFALNLAVDAHLLLHALLVEHGTKTMAAPASVWAVSVGDQQSFYLFLVFHPVLTSLDITHFTHN